MKTRMALNVSLLFVVAAAVIASLAIAYMEGEFKQSIADQQLALAKALGESLDDKILLAQSALVAAGAQLTPTILSDPDRAQRFLNDKRPLQSIFTNKLILFDRHGAPIAAAPHEYDPSRLNPVFREGFQKAAAAGKPVISAPFPASSPDRQLVFALTAPLFDGKGELMGVLAASINLTGANFLGDLSGMKIGRTGYPYLVSSDNVVISHPDPARILEPIAPGLKALFDRARAGSQGGSDTVDCFGRSMLTSCWRLRSTDWVLGLNFPTDEAYAAVEETRLYLALGIAAGTLVVLGLVWLLMQRLTRPFLNVTRQVESMEGSAGLVPLHTTDASYEISTLTASFNRLMATVQKQQKALQENEKKYRFIADNTYDWEFWLSPQLCFIYSSPSGKRITGRESEEFHSDPELLNGMIHPDDRELFRDCLLKAAQTAELQEVECRIVRSDASVRWIAHLCKPVYDEDGAYLGLRGTNRDITDHKRMEDELQQSEGRYRTLVECSPDAVLLQRDGVFIYVNSAALRLLGAQVREQLIGQAVESTVHPEFRALVRERVRQAQLSGEVSPCHEEKMLRMDGTAIDVEAIVTRLSYDGKPAVQVVLRDITERKLAEQALRESEETLRNLLEVMPVGVVLVTREGKFEYVNRCFVDCFGYSPSEVPDIERWYPLAYPDPVYREGLIASLDATLSEAKASGAPVAPVELRISCKDGSVRHVILNRQLAGSRRLAIFTDITQRQSVQNELLKAQKLESLGVLAGGIAHDFNNILTGILGNVTLAQLFLDASHQAFQPLCFAEKAALRAAELATQLLTFAKGGTPVKKLVSLSQIIEESLSLALRGANVNRVVRLARGLHAVQADEGQMSQAFHNIVINALQAMPGGGTLTVDAENLVLSAGNRQSLPSGSYVRITFADEGCGIPDEIQHKIFDPYYTTKSGGTGLGLASVHSIVRKHGGQIEVRSGVGSGAAFTFYLPSIGMAIVSPAGSGQGLVGGGAGKGGVLVMDDEALIRNLATQLLRHLGYQVTSCANGEDAVSLYDAALKSGAPFLAAIMDLTVPGGMGGREAAARILAIDPAARLVVSSGYSHDPVMAEFRSYGFCAAMAKPYRVSELARVLALLTQQAAQSDQSGCLPPAVC